MNKTFYTWKDVETAADAIMLSMYKASWSPDCVVGIADGGLPLALILSQRLGVEMVTVKVDLENSDTECNLWLPEMAIGYVQEDAREVIKSRWDTKARKKILIVNNVNKTGGTINWIKQDWQSSCYPNEVGAWQSVWHHNVRFATMTQVSGSPVEPDFWWHDVEDKNTKVIYPWERESWLKKS